MDITAVLRKDGNKAAESVARHVGGSPARLEQLLEAMSFPEKRVKNAAAKAVRFLSESHPTLLHSYRDRFDELLQTEDSILKWIAVDVIGNLAGSESEPTVEGATLRRLYALLADESMVTASHSIDTLGKIAGSHPRQRARITTELVRVEEIPRNAECRNILLGRTIQTFERYWQNASRPQQARIRQFVERQRRNPLGATRKKAERFLSRVG